MKQILRAAALALSAAVCVAALAGCGAGKASGLTISVCLGSSPETLDPIRATAVSDETVIEHLYENLMRAAADNSGGTTVTGGLAKSYDEDENYDGTVTYTFHLRSAKWSDGAAVTAGDFVYAWQRLADPASQSPSAPLLSIVAGYDEVRATGDSSKLQVEAKNDSTLAVTLTGICPWFLTDVCTAAATMPLRQDVVQSLKEAAIQANNQALSAGGEATETWSSDPAKLVTNGQYCVSSCQEGEELVLTASDRYTGTASGPESITFRFADTAAAAWELYKAKEVDFVSPLPEEQLEKLAGNKDWTAETELNTCTLLFNTGADPFSDPLVRKAFSTSIDRAALSESVGLTAQSAEGLVPSGVPESEEQDFRAAGGALVDCDPEHVEENSALARSLLEQAGYGSGSGFPTVELIYQEGSGERTAVALALTRMWSEVLQVRVSAQAMSEEDYQLALGKGSYTLALADVTGYANDAESFLSAWESGSDRNVVDYYNSAYDTLLTVIDSAGDETARLGCLHDAESLLLEDCPLTPLYYTATAWELRDGLTGLCRDARGWFSFSTVAEVAVN